MKPMNQGELDFWGQAFCAALVAIASAPSWGNVSAEKAASMADRALEERRKRSDKVSYES